MSIIDRSRYVAGTALLLLTGTAMAAAPLLVRRSEGPVTRIDADGDSTDLIGGAAVGNGERLITGADGHATVQLDGGGMFTIADESTVRIHSTEPPDPPARATLLRMRLALGVMRVDARAADKQPPADIRVNLGTLKLRVFGADVWTQALPSGDEVCLLNGAVEILAPGGSERIDQPGECLRYTASGVQRMSAEDVGALAPRLARTAYGDDFPAHYQAELALNSGKAKPMFDELASARIADAAARAAAASRAGETGDTTLRTAAESMPARVLPAEPASPPRERLPTEIATELGPVLQTNALIVTEDPDADTVAIPLPPPEPAVWRVVLASFPERDKAERLATAWRRDGLDVEVMTTQVGERITHRVLSGRYASREEAAQAATPLRQLAGFREAWVLRMPPSAR